MKKLFSLMAIVAILGAIFWLWQNKKPVGQENLPNQKTEESRESVLVSTSTISQTDSFYNIKANYPQFAKADPVFNKKIADLIGGKVDTFKKDAKDYQAARKATAAPGEIVSDNPEEPFDFIADWQSTQLNDQYISFIITMYYFSGGAHGNEEVYAFNYDLAAQKEITVQDFLNSSENNLQKLSDLAIQKVTAYLLANVGSVDEYMAKWIKEGAGPKWENFKDFNFKEDSLIIYFQKYQVAAGAVGPVTVALSMAELNFLK